MLRALCLLTVAVSLSACTTTTRSVNESPRDPHVQRQSTAAPASTPPTTPRATRGRPSAQRLTSAQMDRLSQSEVDNLLIRDQTSAQQVALVFGQPHAMTRSGDEIYWNYTHQFRDERSNVGGLKSLTILFDEHGRVLDYDFQDNRFNLQ